MAILRNLPANIVSEIGVKAQFATHEEWRQNLGNDLCQAQWWKDPFPKNLGFLFMYRKFNFILHWLDLKYLIKDNETRNPI